MASANSALRGFGRRIGATVRLRVHSGEIVTGLRYSSAYVDRRTLLSIYKERTITLVLENNTDSSVELPLRNRQGEFNSRPRLHFLPWKFNCLGRNLSSTPEPPIVQLAPNSSCFSGRPRAEPCIASRCNDG